MCEFAQIVHFVHWMENCTVKCKHVKLKTQKELVSNYVTKSQMNVECVVRFFKVNYTVFTTPKL